MNPLDPWQDAATIAERIASPRNRLIVLLGAEAWCARCKALKPVFMQIAGQAPKHDVMLWLDIETHADFIGDYLPESLPELLIYQGGTPVHRSILDNDPGTLSRALTAPPSLVQHPCPDIGQRLARQDWASEG